MAQDKLINLPWPVGGFVENKALSFQTAENETGSPTTTDALNVRNFDTLDGRLRGGQRAGLSKYIASAVNGSNPIQAISKSVIAFDSNLVVADTIVSSDPNDTSVTESFGYSDGALETVSSSRWTTSETQTDTTLNRLFTAKVNDAESLKVVSSACTVSTSSPSDWRCASLTSKASLGSVYILKYEVSLPAQVSLDQNIGMAWRMLDDTESTGFMSGFHVLLTRNSGTGNEDIDLGLYSSDGGTTLDVTNLGFAVTNGTADFNATVEIVVNGEFVNVFVNDMRLITNYDMASQLSSQDNTGFYIKRNATSVAATVNSITYFTALLPTATRTTKLIVASGGSIYTGNKTDGLAVTTGGSSVFGSTKEVVLQPAFQKIYMSDGSLYKILTTATDTVSDWQTSLSAGALPVGGNGAEYTITDIDVSTSKFTTATDLSSILSAGDFIEVKRGETDNNRTYTVAGVTGGGTVIEVDQTIQSATVSGVLTKGEVTGKILALYRGRFIITGLESDPHNIFMSAVSNPLDFDYFPTVTSATMAIAANITPNFGSIGDVVTNWSTYSDDMAIIGMANSLAVLRGDPAAGGQIDNISQTIGIVGPEAATFDSSGRFYFMGVNGLYRMDLNSFQPILLSQGRLDKTFTEINTNDKRVQLTYDPNNYGVHILIKSQSQQVSTADRHYFWDERTDAFWPDEYPLAHGPIAAFYYTSDDPEENALLFGGFDSVVRALDNDAVADDGTVISSHCRFTPIASGDILASSRLHDITIIMDTNSGNVDCKLYTGDTVEVAEANADAGTVRVKKTIIGGRNSPIRQRVSQNTMIMELSQSGANGVGATWAFEKALARVAILTRMHGRGV